MLTDIFAYRYLDQPIWPQYTDLEQRLLNQAFGIVKDALPYYTSEGKENEKIRDMWKLLHDRLARELGISELSKRYAYTQKNALGQDFPVSGWFSWDHVCDQFVNAKYAGQCAADRFIKEMNKLRRTSFEVARRRGRASQFAAWPKFGPGS